MIAQLAKYLPWISRKTVTLPALQTAFDAGSTPQKAAFQSSVSVAGAASEQAQQLLRNLTIPTRHTSILIIGDSTGNETTEWPYRLCQVIAAKYPAVSVRWRVWIDGTDVYDTPVQVSTGTGAYNLDIWDFSVAGKGTEHGLGSRYYKAVREINQTAVYGAVSPVVDLIIVSHGHNMPDEYGGMIRAHFAEVLDCAVLQTHSQAGVIVVGQNPHSTTTANDSKVREARNYATSRGFGFADVWSRYIALGKASYLYGDTIHPSVGDHPGGNPSGTDLYLDAVLEHFRQMPFVAGPSNVASMSTLGYNLLTNGLFNAWATVPGAPDDWTAVNCTVTKGTGAIVDNPRGKPDPYCVKLTANGTGQPLIEQYFNAGLFNMAKGKTITFAVRIYQPVGTTSTTHGRINLYGGANSGMYTAAVPQPGAWHWRVATIDFTEQVGYGRVQIYLDTNAATPAGAVLYVDAAIAVIGPVPRFAIQ